MITKKWVIYDGRYHTDEDSAQIAVVCDSLKEAEKEMRKFPDDYVIVEEFYEENNN